MASSGIGDGAPASPAGPVSRLSRSPSSGASAASSPGGARTETPTNWPSSSACATHASTIRKYMVKRRGPRGGQTWKTFIRNHASQILAADFLTQRPVHGRVRAGGDGDCLPAHCADQRDDQPGARVGEAADPAGDGLGLIEYSRITAPLVSFPSPPLPAHPEHVNHSLGQNAGHAESPSLRSDPRG